MTLEELRALTAEDSENVLRISMLITQFYFIFQKGLLNDKCTSKQFLPAADPVHGH